MTSGQRGMPRSSGKIVEYERLKNSYIPFVIKVADAILKIAIQISDEAVPVGPR